MIHYFHGGLSVPTVKFRLPLLRRVEELGSEVKYWGARPGRYECPKWLGYRGSQWVRNRCWRSAIERADLKSGDTAVIETGLVHTEDTQNERAIRTRVGRLVYEIDDAVFLTFPGKVAELASISDLVVTGNDAIRDEMVKHNPQVCVVPTLVDERRRGTKPDTTELTRDEPGGHRRDELPQPTSPVVGWIGSASTFPALGSLPGGFKAGEYSASF